jgi:hypothetical protein
MKRRSQPPHAPHSPRAYLGAPGGAWIPHVLPEYGVFTAPWGIEWGISR